MLGQLQIIAGPDRGLLVPLHIGQSVVLGQGQIVVTGLRDPEVAQVHCQVRAASDGAIIADAGAAQAGTSVNGQRLTAPHVLVEGDIIRIGQTQLRYQPAAQPRSETGAGAARQPAEERMLATAAGAPAPVFRKSASSKNRPVIGPGAPLTDLIGRCLARFQVEKVIGTGQHGVVFRANDFERDRPVALKVLNPEFSKNEEEMQRFVRSMKTMLPLYHPNLVTLYAAGRVGGLAWVAMEYVEGDSLAEIVRQIGSKGMLDWRIALRLAIHLANALAYAHQQQIIHRNIVPANVLIRRSDRVAKLGDLMQVKALEGSLAVQLTRPGQVIGNLAYTPPECMENSANADIRSDLYGLGAMVYALLTGRPPFEGSSVADLFAKIRTGELVSPKKAQPHLPDHFEAAILRMLAKIPDERFQTTVDLLETLENIAKFQGLVA
jgi:hypothetical protein